MTGPGEATTDVAGDARDVSAPTGHEAGRAAGDSAWLVGSRIVGAALGWVCSIITARSLDGEGWGEFSLVFALLGLMAIFTDLGVGRAVLGRLMTDDRRELGEVASSFIALRVLLGVLGYVIAVGYTLATGQDQHVVRATLIAGFVVLLATPSHALVVLFQSRLRLRGVAIGDMVSQFVQVSAVVAVALAGGDLLWFVVPPVINEIVNLAWRINGVSRGVLGYRPTRPIRLSLWGSMLRESVPLTIGFALVLLLTKVDMLMLERLDGPVAVGEYAVAYKFSDVLSLAALTAIQPVTTLLVAAWPDEPGAFRARFREAVGALALLGGLGIAAFVPVAHDAITMLYGEQFATSVTPARLLFVAAAVTTITQLSVQTLIASDHKSLFPAIAAAGLVLNVGLNLVAIPRWSTLGAAGATVCTEVLMVLAFWVAVHRSVGRGWGRTAAAPAAIALVTAVVTGLGTYVAGELPGWAWPFVAAATALVYVAVAFATRLVDPRVVALVRSRLPGRPR